MSSDQEKEKLSYYDPTTFAADAKAAAAAVANLPSDPRSVYPAANPEVPHQVSSSTRPTPSPTPGRNAEPAPTPPARFNPGSPSIFNPGAPGSGFTYVPPSRNPPAPTTPAEASRNGREG
jgi:hypothetical protein